MINTLITQRGANWRYLGSEYPGFFASAFFGPAEQLDGLTGPWGQLIFQNGPVPEVGRNGVFIEDVVEVAHARLKDLNEKFACGENRMALSNLQNALYWMNERTMRRQASGIEGQRVEQTPESRRAFPY